MPGGGAGHLGGVIGDDDAVEVVFAQDGEDAEHVHIAVVDEGFAIVGDFAGDVAEVDVGDALLAGVGGDGGVDVVFCHFGESADAEFEGVVGGGGEIEQALVHAGLIDEAGLLADEGQGRVVGVGGETDARGFGGGEDVIEEAAEAVPELVVGGGGEGKRGCAGVNDHVPDGAEGEGLVDGAVHADGEGAAPGPGAGDASRDAGDAEVVAEDGDAGFAHVTKDGFDVFDVLGAAGAVDEDVVPVGGVEVLDGGELEALGFDFAADPDQFGGGPEALGIAGVAPGLGFAAGGLIATGIVAALVEVVDEVDDEVGAAGLTGEGVVLGGEHVTVEAESEVHGGCGITVLEAGGMAQAGGGGNRIPATRVGWPEVPGESCLGDADGGAGDAGGGSASAVPGGGGD